MMAEFIMKSMLFLVGMSLFLALIAAQFPESFHELRTRIDHWILERIRRE